MIQKAYSRVLQYLWFPRSRFSIISPRGMVHTLLGGMLDANLVHEYERIGFIQVSLPCCSFNLSFFSCRITVSIGGACIYPFSERLSCHPVMCLHDASTVVSHSDSALLLGTDSGKQTVRHAYLASSLQDRFLTSLYKAENYLKRFTLRQIKYCRSITTNKGVLKQFLTAVFCYD